MSEHARPSETTGHAGLGRRMGAHARLGPRTLRGRVSLVGLVVIAAWVAVLIAGFNTYLRGRLDGQVDEVLRARAEAAAATVEVARDRRLAVLETPADSTLDQGIWVYQGRRAIERSAGPPQLQALVDAVAADGSGPARADGDRDRLYTVPVVDRGVRIGVVVAGVSLAPYRHAERAALTGSAGVAVLLLVGAYPVLRLAVRRALRPVEAMTRQAAQWSALPGVHHRFGPGPGSGYRELRCLASMLDGVLDRLAAVVRHERLLSAELSHELRTPLSRIIAEADVLLSQPPAVEQRTAQEGIHEGAVRMARILDTLLVTARSDFSGSIGRCVLGQVIERACLTAPTGAAVQIVDPWVALGVDDAVAERIFAPILANANRFADRGVRVTARRVAGQVWVEVTDDGPGIPGDLTEQVFQPGFRADHRDDHDGAGLGLALSRRLARAADGDVVVVPAQKGATIRVCLPPP